MNRHTRRPTVVAVVVALPRRPPTTASAAIAGRDGAAAVWTDRQMLVWGGHGRVPEGLQPLRDGAAYDPASARWRVLAAAPIGARLDHAAAWTGPGC